MNYSNSQSWGISFDWYRPIIRRLRYIGFKGICSDEIIRYNIEKEKRSWCSFEDCPCRKYLDEIISREELENIYREDLVCYESVSLSEWIAHAGTDLRGINAGKSRRLPNAQLGSLAVFTTRFPYTEEEERVIVGAFIVDTACEGDDSKEGTVSAKSQYKIAVRPDETSRLKFWNYYRNEKHPESIRWGTGLYRFVKDEDAIRILEDIVAVKEGKEDYGIAVDLLDYYKKLHSAPERS